jgi:cytochrome c oxidase cbb3-type subunit 3
MATIQQDQNSGGVGTTGHQWDDDDGFPLQEYNNPLPTWWLYTFYATIVWAVVYWFFFPTWPTGNGYTKGLLGWSTVQELEESVKAAEKQRAVYDVKLASVSAEDISKDPQLRAFALSGGKAIFGDNCAPCHGSGGGGAKGIPNLVDDDWLYGGSLGTITETVQKGRIAMMPAHLDQAGGAFTDAQVKDLVEYVLTLAKKPGDATAAARGDKLFHGDAGCNNCHGDAGMGSLKDSVGGTKIDTSVGAPNLTDGIWLYGGDRDTIYTTIAKGRNGHMPSWEARFNPLAVKKVALYVQSLSGGVR